jgi:hypothetical protein
MLRTEKYMDRFENLIKISKCDIPLMRSIFGETYFKYRHALSPPPLPHV